MTRFFTPRRIAILALAVLALPFALAGCSEKITRVDADYTQLEGISNPDAQLLAWPDTPTEVRTYLDRGTPGPSFNPGDATLSDSLIEVTQVYRTGPGAVQTMLLDGSAATGFEFFRTASNGGMQPMRDYVVNSPRKWLDSHWELYELTDTSPSGYAPATYMGRGLLAGTTTSSSPLTNPARLTATTSKSLVYTGAAFPVRSDSNFTMSWGAVPGAAGYWMHVYQFRSDALNEEYIRSATPSPIWNGKVRDVFVGYIAAPAVEYKLGTTGARVLTYKAPIAGQVYMVRISAVDAQGQLIACSGTDLSRLSVSPEGAILNVTGASFAIDLEEGLWKIYSLGAYAVNPGGTSGAPSFGAREMGAAAPGTRIYNAGTKGR